MRTTETILQKTVIGCRWQETRRSRKSVRTRTMSAASTVTSKAPPIHTDPAPSSHIPPPGLPKLHGHKLNLKSSQTHMTIENDSPAHKTILYTFTLTRCIFQEAIQPHLYTETRSAQHQWLHPNPPQPAQEHR